MARQIAAEDVGERGQTVVCLVRGDVVDVRRVTQVRGLVSDMAGRRVRVVSPRERLAKGGGLDDPFVRKLLVRGCDDTQAWRRATLASQAWCFRGEMAAILILVAILLLLLLLL